MMEGGLGEPSEGAGQGAPGGGAASEQAPERVSHRNGRKVSREGISSER